MYDRTELIRLFRERALKFGDFTLVGEESQLLPGWKQITLHSAGLRLVSEGLLDLLADIKCDGFGGMSIGADPIVGGVLTVAADRGRKLEGFLVRKEAKGHGTGKFIEGPVQPGMHVVIVDDVVTTGGSSLQAIERFRGIWLQGCGGGGDHRPDGGRRR